MSEKNLNELKHTQVPIIGGGEVIILDTGAAIGPESAAMLQALHSRSIGGLKDHLKILAEKGPENFMKNFYVGYGHKSIGDCGSTSIFVEGISMLAAKAIQDWPLYSGQESSTRYIDFQIQPLRNPLGSKIGEEILEGWRSFYIKMLEPTKESLKKRFPIQDGEKESIYSKAINARAFDTLRGFLPAGSVTNIAWHTNLRQAADKLMLLRNHPLSEVRNIAQAIEKALQDAFPNSFGHELFPHTEEYNKMWLSKYYYYHDPKCPDFKITKNSIDPKELPKEILAARPMKTELPKYLAELGTLQMEFLLDFGSFRDLQRHRSIIQRMPLLTTNIGFEPWYLQELPETLQAEAKKFLAEQEEKITRLDISEEEKQYYTAMGYRVSNKITGGLPALVYITELRATRFVHPTLRKVAKIMAKSLKDLFGKNGLILHLDEEPDRFDVRRGEQDIVLK